MAKVIIFGIGQIAEVAHFYLSTDSTHKVVAFCVDKEFIDKDNFHDLPVVAYEDIKNKYPPSKYKIFIPISYKKINLLRTNKFKDAKRKGYECISYISTKAINHSNNIGENCFIFENNVIQPFVNIGDNCILWSGNHIGHHTVIEDNCFIASQVVISGNVTIKESSFLGVNATIRDNITIGRENVIGAGSIILEDTEDKSVFSPRQTDKSRVPSNRLRGI